MNIRRIGKGSRNPTIIYREPPETARGKSCLYVSNGKQNGVMVNRMVNRME